MILLLDIGNTNTHLGLAKGRKIVRRLNVPTRTWFDFGSDEVLAEYVGDATLTGAAFCSVVPRATTKAKQIIRKRFGIEPVTCTARGVPGLKIDYPRPESIGPDRLANAVAALHLYGVPVVVLDFGTALTIDVVDERGCYVGGVIAPGVEALSSYLHERTALLPKITLRRPKRAIGRNTREAMRIGVVRGYYGLVRELLQAVLEEVRSEHVRIVATGGYARLIASEVKEIGLVNLTLTLEGVRLFWEAESNRWLEQQRGSTPFPTGDAGLRYPGACNKRVKPPKAAS